ncbi:MAG TPA: S8 family serine peptidase, partial [Xanthobacteraceae bacterium]|nr:S8 family serine peptidase [Xanthobacteraceae bacterium]
GSGNGGKVVLWSNQQTTFAGTILAQGGALGGDGGFVETSSHGAVNFAGAQVNTMALNGATGTWLVDPTDLVIDSTAAATISTDLATSNVTLTTFASGAPSGPAGTTGNTNTPTESAPQGDIWVEGNISWSSPNTLTLSAYHDINFGVPDPLAATITSTGAGNLILRADNTGRGIGTVNFYFGGVDFSGGTGTVSIYYNPTARIDCEVNCGKYQNPLDSYFDRYVTGSNKTYYMLVNSAADLTEIGQSAIDGVITGNFALGKNIDATGFTGMGDVTFNGLFDGNGGLGTNYTISKLTLSANLHAFDSTGLFPFIGTSGVVRNLNLANVTLTTQLDNQIIGSVAGTNDGTISNVNVLSGTINGGAHVGIGAGGLVGKNGFNGSITRSSANVAVTVGDTTNPEQMNMAGGLFSVNQGSAFQSFATGPVIGGAESWVGGLGAENLGSLQQVFATGAAKGGDGSSVAGLVAVNSSDEEGFGIKDAYATGAASGGANSAVAGLVAMNGYSIQTSYSVGPVSGGAGSTLGGLVAVNQFNDSTGTVTNSYWNTQISGQNSSPGGGTGMTSQQLASGLPAGFSNTVWTILPDPSFPYFPWQTSNIPTVDLGPGSPNPPPQQQIIDNLTNSLVLVSLPPPVNVLPPPPPPPGPGPQFGGLPRLIAVPPPGETRYVMNEALMMVDCDAPQSALDQATRALQLTVLDQQCLMVSNMKLLRLHINNGRSVADVIRALARYRIVAVAQANFIYRTMQDKGGQETTPNPDLAGRTQEGDEAQYALSKLGVIDIHKQIKGDNVSIAIIDSQIDTHHPDLDGVFADQYNAVGVDEKPHPHGTGMAGAIAAHRRLMGIAPDARIYAIHAFSSNAASADSTTFNILKGIDWAIGKGVRVINMSFAGPRDPSMERSLKAAHDKGIVLVAAAGNGGPKSPPLYPGADPDVIAVTATDVDDRIFAGANRGKYIAVAAPGVDILVPAPDNTYQLTTGTSVSSAEVAGVAALLLQRNPNLTPEDIRKILTTSAKHPGAKERDDDFGSGLVDPSKAILDAGAIKPIGQPTKR